MGQETYRVTHRSIRYEGVEPIIAKNKQDPVPAWLAVEPRSWVAPTAQRDTIPRSGQRARLLEDVWERTVVGRRAHLVTILGEPGIGKSRIADELTGQIETSGGRSLLMRELPYTQSAGYETFRQLLKDWPGSSSWTSTRWSTRS